MNGADLSERFVAIMVERNAVALQTKLAHLALTLFAHTGINIICTCRKVMSGEGSGKS